MAIKHIEQIKEMREKGMTYQAIADELGRSRQCVYYTAQIAGIANSHYKHEKVIYQGVKDWLIKHKMSLHDFCIKCGEKFGSSSKTYKFLTGEYKGDIHLIKKILDTSGLIFEEAFQEVKNENKEEN